MGLWLALLITVLISRIYSAVQPTKSNENSNQILESHVLKLEQTVKDLQAKSQVQEQKYTAVLSSVLSKLTSTTDELKGVKTELGTLKTNYKSLQTEFNELKLKQAVQEDEILRLRADVNVSETDIQSVMSSVGDLTLSLNSSKEEMRLLNIDITSISPNLKDVNHDKLKLTANATDVRLKMVEAEVLSITGGLNTTRRDITSMESSLKILSSLQLNLTSNVEDTKKEVLQLKNNITAIESLNTTGTLQTLSQQMNGLQTDVFFQGSMQGANKLLVKANTVWKIAQAKGNRGLCFNFTTGYFTAPISGSYMFWVNALVVRPTKDVIVRIKDESRDVGLFIGGSLHGNNDHAFVTGIVTAHVRIGTRMWFSPDVSVTFVDKMSFYGGALLQPSDL